MADHKQHPDLDQLRETIPGLKKRWAKYAPYCSEMKVGARTVILKEGEIPRRIFFVKQGCLRASVAARGKEVTFQFFFEGDAVASSEGFRSRQPSTISITAIEPSVLFTMSREGFGKIVHDFPVVKDIMLETAFRRFEHYARLFLSYISNTPRQRYLALLQGDPRIMERVPQRYIASYLGITPVSLSRIRGRL
jgi:CRP-like cAMP-binding protein